MLTPLDSLSRQLASVLAGFSLGGATFGLPEIVHSASVESEKLFQGYAKAKPSKADAYAAALAFLKGVHLDERQRDLVAGALCEPVREVRNARVVGHARFASLLESFEQEAQMGDLWRLTWYGLLSSYFAFDPATGTDADHAGWGALREALRRTWPFIEKASQGHALPDWMRVMQAEPQVLTERAAVKYAKDFLRGHDEAVQQLAADLSIPESSWFWHALVLETVQQAAALGDAQFKASIPRLLTLVQQRPVFRDDALEVVLIRFHKCVDRSPDQRLADYVVRKDVWRNPKLKAAGIATAWNRVPEPVWQMVLGWVNRANLKDFFDVLAARNKADEGRLAFWSRYMDQIAWTRLIFGSDTLALANRQPAVRELIAREEGAYATLSKNKDVDAFMMQIGDYTIVEFSKKPNACYVYPTRKLAFDAYEASYSGDGEDLKYGYGAADPSIARLLHLPGWESEAGSQLRSRGIFPDTDKRARGAVAPVVRQEPAIAEKRPLPPAGARAAGPATVRGAVVPPADAMFTMEGLINTVTSYPRAFVDDRRSTTNGGRLWIEDPMQHAALGATLKSWGFKWASSRTAWYYPET